MDSKLLFKKLNRKAKTSLIHFVISGVFLTVNKHFYKGQRGEICCMLNYYPKIHQNITICFYQCYSPQFFRCYALGQKHMAQVSCRFHLSHPLFLTTRRILQNDETVNTFMLPSVEKKLIKYHLEWQISTLRKKLSNTLRKALNLIGLKALGRKLGDEENLATATHGGIDEIVSFLTEVSEIRGDEIHPSVFSRSATSPS